MKLARSFWVWLAAFYVGAVAVVGAFALVAGAGIDEAKRPAIAGVLAEAAPGLIYAMVATFSPSTSRAARHGETPDIYLGHVTVVDGRPTFIADTEC